MSQAFHGGNLIAAAERFNREPDQFIDFSSNLNIWLKPLLPLGDKLYEAITRYPEVDATMLRHQIASIYQVDPSHILPTAGAAEALYLGMRLFTGNRVCIIEPAFSDYSRACLAAGVAFHSIELRHEEWFAPIKDYADRLIEFDVIVLGNPNNPTGHAHPRSDLIEIIQRFAEKAWVIDEAFIEFVERYEDETLLSVLKDLPRVIVMGSLTKSWRIPGLRLGFLATSHVEWMEMAARMQPPWSVNGIAQLWAKHNFNKSGWAEMRQSLAQLPKLRATFTSELERVHQVRPHRSHANFLLLELLSGSAFELIETLGKQGMLVRLCDSFSGVPRDRFIRIAIRNEDENQKLVNAIARFFETGARRE